MCVCPEVSFGEFPIKHLPSCLLFCGGFEDQTSSTGNVSTLFTSLYTEIEECNHVKQEYKNDENTQWKKVTKKCKKFKRAARNDEEEKTDCNRFNVLINEEPDPKNKEKATIDGYSVSPVFEVKNIKKEDICVLQVCDSRFSENSFTTVPKKKCANLKPKMKAYHETICLRVFESKNTFSLLADNQEEEFDSLWFNV